MSAPTSTNWVVGYQAFIDAEGRGRSYAREPARWNGAHWESLVGRGLWSPQYVTSVTPLYMVSLDAAIEAAAKALCEQAGKGSDYAPGWDACTDKEMHRRTVRPLVTAAVMGGAQ